MLVYFRVPYQESISMMLHILLVRVNDKIHVEGDSQILYTRIVKLIQKLTLQMYNLDNPTGFLNHAIDELNKAKQSLSVPASQTKGKTRAFVIDAQMLTNLLIKNIDNFKRTFLVDTKEIDY